MKFFKSALLIVVLGFSSVGVSQECDMYFPLIEGNSWVVSNYNKKGKLQTEELNTIVSKETTAEGEKATIKIEVLDKKKKEEETTVELTYKVECKAGELIMDMQMYIPQEQTESSQSAEVIMEATNVEFPSNLKVGQELEDASVSAVLSTTGMTMFTINIVDRKVIAIENLTTPAGTFECYKITQTAKMKIVFLNITATTITYFSKGVGVVRTENYSKNGKLTDYSELTKIN